MTDQGTKARFFGRTLHFICLCASLALFISIASPEDDDFQQESVPCGKYQTFKLIAISHPADVPSRIASYPSAAVALLRIQFTPAWLLSNIDRILLSGRTAVPQRNDLPPPALLL